MYIYISNKLYVAHRNTPVSFTLYTMHNNNKYWHMVSHYLIIERLVGDVGRDEVYSINLFFYIW